jgi:hypothetical protein
MRIENMVIGATGDSFIAVAEIVSRRWWGPQVRRVVTCVKIGALSGGHWVWADSGQPVGFEKGLRLNDKAQITALKGI